MKKLIVITAIGLGVLMSMPVKGAWYDFLIPKKLGAPVSSLYRSVVPETTATFYVGTSTATFKGAYFDEICLAGSCQTGWGTSSFGNDFYTYFSATTTDYLTEGSTNKYFTNGLFDTRLSATTSLPNITTLAGLSILKAQVSDFGTYEAPLTFTYPLTRSVNTISTALATTSNNTWAGTQTFGTLQATTIGTSGLRIPEIYSDTLRTQWLEISANVVDNSMKIGSSTNASAASLLLQNTGGTGTLSYSTGNVFSFDKLVNMNANASTTQLTVTDQSWFDGATHGISLYEIEDLTADKTFTMADKNLTFNFTTPNNGLTLNATGAFTDHVLHVHQSVGNPGAGTQLAHLHAEDSDVILLNLEQGAASSSPAIKVLSGTSDFSGGLATMVNASTTRLTLNTLFDNDGDIGSSGQILSSTGSLTNWITPTTYENPLTFNYPLTRSVNAISTAFGTTTANTFNNTNDFSSATMKMHQYPSFSYATSTAWSATTTIAMGPAYTAELWNGLKCYTDVGTLNVSIHDGTNRMNMMVGASTTIGTYTLSTNNTFTASEKIYIDIGTPATAPTKISCSIDKIVNN